MPRAFGLRYDPTEDRLEAEVESPDGARYRLHLTRRVCAHLAARFDKIVQISAEVPASADAQVRKVIASAHHDALASRVSIGRSERAADCPGARTGDHPALVVGIRCGRRRSDQKWVLEFQYRSPGRGPDSVSLILSQRALHGVIELFRQTLARTGWDLSLLHTTSGTGVARSMH